MFRPAHQLSGAQRDHFYELSFQNPHIKYTDVVEEVDNCRSWWNSVRRIRLKEKSVIAVKSEYILSYLCRRRIIKRNLKMKNLQMINMSRSQV